MTGTIDDRIQELEQEIERLREKRVGDDPYPDTELPSSVLTQRQREIILGAMMTLVSVENALREHV